MCNHIKFKTSENDRKFLKSLHIAPFECAMCEGQKPQKQLPPPKLRLEEPPEKKE